MKNPYQQPSDYGIPGTTTIQTDHHPTGMQSTLYPWWTIDVQPRTRWDDTPRQCDLIYFYFTLDTPVVVVARSNPTLYIHLRPTYIYLHPKHVNPELTDPWPRVPSLLSRSLEQLQFKSSSHQGVSVSLSRKAVLPRRRPLPNRTDTLRLPHGGSIEVATAAARNRPARHALNIQ